MSLAQLLAFHRRNNMIDVSECAVSVHAFCQFQDLEEKDGCTKVLHPAQVPCDGSSLQLDCTGQRMMGDCLIPCWSELSCMLESTGACRAMLEQYSVCCRCTAQATLLRGDELG